MAKSTFEHRLHELKYFEVGSPPFSSLNPIYYEGNITKFVENHQFNVILSCFKQILNNHVFNISSYTLFAPSSTTCRFFFWIFSFFLST